MERNQFWVLIGIFVAFAVAMGALSDKSGGKRIRGLSARFADIENTGMVAGMDARMGRIEGSNAQPVSATIEHADEIKPIKAEAKVKDAKKIAKTDAAKEAAAKKKKSKKKKVTKGGMPESVPAPSTSSDDEDYESDFDTAQTETDEQVETYVAPQAVAAKTDKEKEIEGIPTTEKEWEALILGQPNKKNVEKLVKYYLTKVVKEDVFYSIIEKMLKDSRSQMQDLAVQALAATPSSKSFATLVTVAYEGTADASVKTNAQRYLLNYSRANHLPALRAALQNPASTSTTQLEALRLLNIALQGPSTAPQTPGSTGSPTVQPTALNPAILLSFREVLTQLQETATNGQVKQEAASTLNVVNTALQNDPSQSTPTVANM